jgi:hypothetical protein
MIFLIPLPISLILTPLLIVSFVYLGGIFDGHASHATGMEWLLASPAIGVSLLFCWYVIRLVLVVGRWLCQITSPNEEGNHQ